MATQGFLKIRVPETSVDALAKLPAGKKDELVKKCVHAIIVLGQDRQPIKKEDLSRLVFHSIGNYRVVNGIIHMANEELQDTFGMQLYMFQDKSQPKFFLVNTSLDFNEYQMPRSEEENEELVLLHFALSEIFLSHDFRSSFEELEKACKPFELKDSGSEYLKSFIDRFVKLMYLSTMKHQDLTWYVCGPRAYAEYNLDELFDRFLQLAKETNVEAWPDLVQRLDKMKKAQGLVSF